MSRYNRNVVTMEDSMYKHTLKKRGRDFIDHYGTVVMRELTDEEKNELDIITYIWGLGDRYYKLANTFYDDPTLWWIIAWYNKAPTESHLSEGDEIYIPTPIDRVLLYYGG